MPPLIEVLGARALFALCTSGTVTGVSVTGVLVARCVDSLCRVSDSSDSMQGVGSVEPAGIQRHVLRSTCSYE